MIEYEGYCVREPGIQMPSSVGGRRPLVDFRGEGMYWMAINQKNFDLIRDIIEPETYQLTSWEYIDFDHLNNWIERILDDDVFNAYMEYFCFEKRIPMKQVINHLEKAIIVWALLKNEGNLRKTARFLDIEPATLSRKMDRYTILLQDFRDRTSQDQN
jgi:hypothetical protein